MVTERSPKKTTAPCARPVRTDLELRVDKADRGRRALKVAPADAPRVADKEAAVKRLPQLPRRISNPHFPTGSSVLNALLPRRLTFDK